MKNYSSILFSGIIVSHLFIGLTTACGQVGMSVGQENSPPAMEEHVPNELLVKFKEGISSDGIQTIHSQMGTQVIQVMADGLLYQVAIPASAKLDEVKKSYESLPEVEYVEVNYVVGIEGESETK